MLFASAGGGGERGGALRRPRCAARRPRRGAVVGRRAAHRATTSSGSAARTTARTRWPPRRSCSPAAWRAPPCARGWRRSPASRTGSRRSPRHDGVLYVNDSKATNVASAIAGIESFEGGLHLILGGSRKAGGYAPLAGPVAAARPRRLPDRRDRAGDRAPRWRAPACRCTTAATSRRAVAAARAAARPGEVVLLSPGLRLLRPVRRLRGARRALPRARGLSRKAGRRSGCRNQLRCTDASRRSRSSTGCCSPQPCACSRAAR